MKKSNLIIMISLAIILIVASSAILFMGASKESEISQTPAGMSQTTVTNITPTTTAEPTSSPDPATTSEPTYTPVPATTSEPIYTPVPTTTSEATDDTPLPTTTPELTEDTPESTHVPELATEPNTPSTVTPETAVNEQKPLQGVIIGIDAGHQLKGNNEQEKVSPNSSETKPKVSSGTQGVASGVPEYVVNLDVALLLKEKLESLGAVTIMSREVHDVDVSNVERAVMMNKEGADLCVRIHCNGSDNQSVSGAMMLVPKNNPISGIDSKSYEAGEIIFGEFLDATNAKNAGIIYRSDLTGFNWSGVPVCLIEMGFMSNPTEDKLLTSPDYQLKCAEGLTNGIVKWWLAKN